MEKGVREGEWKGFKVVDAVPSEWNRRGDKVR